MPYRFESHLVVEMTEHDAQALAVERVEGDVYR